MRTSLALIALLALAVPTGVNAQLVLGVGGGFRSASLAFDDDLEGPDESRTGVSVHGFVGIPLSETFRIQPGLAYGQKGGKESEGSAEITLELDYLEVPILGVFSVPSEGPVGFHLYGGPYLAFEIGCQLSGDTGQGTSASIDCDEGDIPTKSPDFGAMIGGAVSYATSETMSLYLSAYYGIGFTDVNDDPDDDTAVKNRAFGLDVGLAFITGG